MKFLRNLTVGMKLILLMSISTISLTTVGIAGISFVRHVAEDSEIMYEDNVLPLRTIMQIRINARAIDAYTLELLSMNNAARSKELNDEVVSAWNEMDEMILELSSANDLFEEEKEYLKQYEVISKELKESGLAVRNLASENKKEDAYAMYVNKVEGQRKQLNDTLKAFQASQVNTAGLIQKENEASVQTATITIVVVILISLIVLIGSGLVIVRMIVNPVRQVKNLLIEAEKGDFTVKGGYQSKDELGELTDSYNQMSRKLQAAFKTINDSSLLVASSSEELSASAEQNSKVSEHVALTIQELAIGAERQVDEIKETSEVISEVNEYTKVISEHTANMKDNAFHASKVSMEGNLAIENVHIQMNSISSNVSSLYETINNLNEHSSQIENIINVISDISSQTNLLALNAAIEAARAGENGRGFAVVASEVRKLAEQSSQSTEQISKIIRLIQSNTGRTIETMERTADEVKNGMIVVTHAGESFKNIEEAVSRVVNQIEDIADAVMRVAERIEDVNAKTINVKDVSEGSAEKSQTISGATEEQLASMEEVSSSSQALASLADELQKIISQFKV
jgi:methyl-accepting chemotaxis protein